MSRCVVSFFFRKVRLMVGSIYFCFICRVLSGRILMLQIFTALRNVRCFS